MKRVSSVLIIALAVLMLFAGCNANPDKGNGVAKVSIENSMTKAIAPEAWDGVDYTGYKVEVYKANDQSAAITSVDLDVETTDADISLPVGKYVFKAYAYTGEKVTAAEGKSDVISITSRTETNVSITVNAVGTGNLKVNISYGDKVESIKDAAVTLKGVSLESERSLTIDNNNVITADGLDAGTYMLNIACTIVTESGLEVPYSKSEMVYIVKDEASEAAWTIDFVGNTPFIKIENNIGTPVFIEVEYDRENVQFENDIYYFYTGAEVEFSVEEIEGYTYEWKLDGSVVSVTSSASVKYGEVRSGKFELSITSEAGTTYGYGYIALNLESLVTNSANAAVK